MSYGPDYPLQGSPLDLPLEDVLSFSDARRNTYVVELIDALRCEAQNDTMTLKPRVSFKKEMRDLRNLLRQPADKYLYTDDKTLKRNVLGRGAPGGTHTYWSRHQMWKMKTKIGDLHGLLMSRSPALTSSLTRFFDPHNRSKMKLRSESKTAVGNALAYLQFQMGSGSAFPPFHARFFAERYLPSEGDCIVIDPCAGWGGRLLGTLSVRRKGKVTYHGVDPEKRNRSAYEGLERRLNIWLRRELSGIREARLSYRPFEDWIRTAGARALSGKADLVITSPPYFSAENYNPANANQSANRYGSYEDWHENFYRVLIESAFELLKPNGVFVLNVANVAEAPRLEYHASRLAADAGFQRIDFFKLAMGVTPGKRKSTVLRRGVIVDGVAYHKEPVFCFRKPPLQGSPAHGKTATS